MIPAEVGISAREAEVLAALGEHLTNAEIGARLFISVRTVESHVSSLLRKLRVDDRRALAAVSANFHSDPAGGAAAPTVVAALPSPLTPFVGRVAERAALTRALREHRLVTAVGPGGVGKTRLALRVAADANDRFADGVWYVDLVPVTDPLMVAPAIADALGLRESQGRSAADNVLGHLATVRLLVVTALAGDWDETAALAERFREGWERAGRPRASNLSQGPYAAGTVDGLRGDDDARAEWLDIVNGFGRPLGRLYMTKFFDALLLLHRGLSQQAVELLDTPPEQLNDWYNGGWRPWYAALWAEAAVLSGHEDAAGRVRRARLIAAKHPIAAAIVDRAAAMTGRAGPGGSGGSGGSVGSVGSGGPDRDGLSAAAAALASAGCRYQWARSLVFLGGEQRARGESELASMGATAMVWPPR